MTTAASSRVAGTTQEAQHLLPEGSSGCKVNIKIMIIRPLLVYLFRKFCLIAFLRFVRGVFRFVLHTVKPPAAELLTSLGYFTLDAAIQK
jgi:hypothetical protein